jgi:hypothetical protein
MLLLESVKDTFHFNWSFVLLVVFRLNKMFDENHLIEGRNCGERARDGRGLVTASAERWDFSWGQSRDGTPGQPDRSHVRGALGGGNGWGRAIMKICLASIGK